MAKKLEELKSSEHHKIIAVILEAMEKSGYDTKAQNTSIEEVEKTGVWKMTFTKEKLSLEDIVKTKESLGENFSLTILPKSRKEVYITIEAPGEAFISLIS